MDFIVFSAVLFAALLHALWNALVKHGDDKPVGMTGVVIGYAPISIIALLFVPAPQPESLPYILGSIVLHTAYHCFLLSSYRLGDLTLVYPIARGVAPIIIALISVYFLGVSLSQLEFSALILIVSGVFSLGVMTGDGSSQASRATKFAVTTGVFIAAYTINDGIGVGLSGTAIGYFAWVGFGSAVVWLVLMCWLRPEAVISLPKRGKAAFFIGSNASFVAYTLILWAYTQASIPMVSALREVGIVFAMLIGLGVLRERIDLKKVMSTMLALLGVMLLKFSK